MKKSLRKALGIFLCEFLFVSIVMATASFFMWTAFYFNMKLDANIIKDHPYCYTREILNNTEGQRVEIIKGQDIPCPK